MFAARRRANVDCGEDAKLKEYMYNHNSFLIVALLLLVLLVAIEAGYRAGKKFADVNDKPKKSQISAIQGSILGMLALLLGFTFSLSLQRYDTRSQAVINEANAIGTVALRAGLIPEALRASTKDLVREYLDLRIRASEISLDRPDERRAILLQSEQVFNSLWAMAQQAGNEDPSALRSGYFVQALNDMIDAYGSRDAALSRHVPELVLFLMFGTLILTASLVGYGSGVAGHRATFAAYTLLLLIICLVFVVIDLDRPRRGLIEVSQQSLIDLRTSPVFTEAVRH